MLLKVKMKIWHGQLILQKIDILQDSNTVLLYLRNGSWKFSFPREKISDPFI